MLFENYGPLYAQIYVKNFEIGVPQKYSLKIDIRQVLYYIWTVMFSRGNAGERRSPMRNFKPGVNAVPLIDHSVVQLFV